jgi:hypothetical protein
MMQLKMHGFWTILYVWQEMVSSSQEPPEGGCWAPFFAIGGMKEAPRATVREYVTHGRSPSSGMWGTPVPMHFFNCPPLTFRKF